MQGQDLEKNNLLFIEGATGIHKRYSNMFSSIGISFEIENGEIIITHSQQIEVENTSSRILELLYDSNRDVFKCDNHFCKKNHLKKIRDAIDTD